MISMEALLQMQFPFCCPWRFHMKFASRYIIILLEQRMLFLHHYDRKIWRVPKSPLGVTMPPSSPPEAVTGKGKMALNPSGSTPELQGLHKLLKWSSCVGFRHFEEWKIQEVPRRKEICLDRLEGFALFR